VLTEGNVQPLKPEEEDVKILKTSVGHKQVAEVTATMTSTLSGNDYKILFSTYLSCIASDLNCFSETSVGLLQA